MGMEAAAADFANVQTRDAGDYAVRSESEGEAGKKAVTVERCDDAKQN
jgi:hypothetical protein